MDRRKFLLNCAGVAVGALSTTGCERPSRKVEISSANSLPEWAIGPFTKHGAPVLEPTPESIFHCPVSGRDIKWEEQNVYNPAAVVRGNKLWLLYRGDDLVGHDQWDRTCRTGLAWSDDGVHFERRGTPVLYPDNDAFQKYEWVGGPEDIHIVESEGTYIVNYTAFNGTTDAMIVATSDDLTNWTKRGPAFGEKTDDPLFRDRTGVVVTQLVDGKLKPVRINGKYWMYYFLTSAVATSDNLLDWTPLANAEGTPLIGLPSRPGFFDSGSCEAGAIALLTDHGIVLFYNAYNCSPEEGGDPSLPTGWSSLGQALMDRDDPTRVLERLDKPFLQADLDWEFNGFIEVGFVSNALVPFNGEWMLYYGAADRRIGMARCLL